MTIALEFERLETPDEIGALRYRIPSGVNDARVRSIGLPDAKLLELPDGRTAVEPSMFYGQHSWTIRSKYHWTGSVHAKCDVQLFRPIAVDTDITVLSRISETYERRHGKYVVFELDTLDENGELAVRAHNTVLMNFAEARDKRDATRAAAAVKEVAASDDALMPIEQRFGPTRFDRDRMIEYFGCEEAVYGPLPSIHNLPERAARLGLPDIIAPGRYALGLIGAGLFRLHGTAWMTQARWSTAIRNNLLPGTDTVASLHLADEGEGGRRFLFDYLDVGTARALVSGELVLGANDRATPQS